MLCLRRETHEPQSRVTNTHQHVQRYVSTDYNKTFERKRDAEMQNCYGTNERWEKKIGSELNSNN